MREKYEAYNKAFMVLDNESWQILKEKALRHYLDHREGQTKQGFFNQLNEAFAYQYLVNIKGVKDIQLLKEGKSKTPDIKFIVNNNPLYCEVKTLNISDDEIKHRETFSVGDSSIYENLSNGFLNKFKNAVESALEQINVCGANGLVCVLIISDDLTYENYPNYKKQLIEFSDKNGFSNLFIKVGLLENREICIKIEW
ncbi:hypothetical protein ACFL40_04125 [candidate division KSB1 bacterium]